MSEPSVWQVFCWPAATVRLRRDLGWQWITCSARRLFWQMAGAYGPPLRTMKTYSGHFEEEAAILVSLPLCAFASTLWPKSWRGSSCSLGRRPIQCCADTRRSCLPLQTNSRCWQANSPGRMAVRSCSLDQSGLEEEEREKNTSLVCSASASPC